MLDNIIQYSIKNKLIIGLMTMGLLILGGYSLKQLPIDAVPDITNNQVQVITTSPSLAAEEIERLITFPIEITMATIPDIEEIRSFSRFGLSVVTIVFKEKVDVYWARQQVSERLDEAQQEIPADAGRPGMAPVTTGLGEIYQYVMDTKPGFEDKYTVMELRTIQDWIVRRQLLGTPGVAEVSSFGGYLKQYEIAINTGQLKAMGVSIKEIFDALEANNENTGGAYIERGPNAYFIRTEGLVGDLKQIEAIAIKSNKSGIPVLIKDVAKVQLGHSVRYGATTRNGQGEVVSAIVMMLKGANSAEVIKNIKERIVEIQKTLPEGVIIEPFLDRAKLIDAAIGTVTTNLIEGALIVVFILLLLLGNLRAGLIVASVIPLALLFAFSLMNLFGVSGNLMSLGAIDFGLIVDGAVIIVEATFHHLGLLKLGRKLTQSEMDDEVYNSASKIRNSAAFGEIIILIVYLPILALVGTEGKMFGPMAQTVSFAILGAFILSLTYIPMMSALFLSKNTEYKRNISDKIMDVFHRAYGPLIKWAMHKRVVILAIAMMLFASSLFVFSRMGGEFIPTLEEGDFAVETRVLTGSSLQTTIEATTKAEKILLANFPEVTQVVSKIGAGEIPTDPMPIEAADLMIILKDKDDWVSASNREELANLMSEALEVIPGVSFGFQQPIQMRFNELMTGVRQDVAIKVYGEDLNRLSEYANQIGSIVSGIEGAADLYIEEVTGIPQILVTYKRDQLAKYGLNVAEVNRTVQVAFAGASTGKVYEGEKKFDMVVRLDKTSRHGLEDVRNLYISRADGHQIPLSQVANVSIKDGPYQIQRDDTRRRIIVAFNVRNRDVQSIVQEIGNKIENNISFDPGYSIKYGGQFENLIQAKERLSVAVPLALLLIFVLLYFTFKSLKQGILIFTAIPLSAIGGIFALWVRDMPFSISAGVGFIALFGVAVLNGIVLIGEFNKLKKEGISDVFERIYTGTRIRLRPVILTAAVASMGFLPMALSQSSGAEVQKPLATVVIGGLITATFLTLIVLPILYYYFERNVKTNMKPVAAVLLLLVVGTSSNLQAQNEPKTYRSIEEVINSAIANNPQLKVSDMRIAGEKALKKGSWSLPKTNISWTHGQYNSINNGDNQFNINQSFAFPTLYANQQKLNGEKVKQREMEKAVTQNELVRQVKQVYYNLWLEESKRKLLLQQDSLFQRFANAAILRYQVGETNLLEKVTAESQVAEIGVMIQQNRADINAYEALLAAILNTTDISVQFGEFAASDFDIESQELQVDNNPLLAVVRQQLQIAAQEKAVEKSALLPDINLGYFNQSLIGSGLDIDGNPVVYTGSDRFTGFSVGLAVPIFTKRSGVKAKDWHKQERAAQLEVQQLQLSSKLRVLISQYQKHKESIAYYERSLLPQADLILNQVQKGLSNGEIGYVEYMQGLTRNLDIQSKYLETINQYNQVVILIESVIGE